MSNHHETAPIEAFIERPVWRQADQHSGMVGEFEVVIGDQQNTPVILHGDVTGFSPRYAGWQPAIAGADGQVAGQAYHFAAIFTKVRVGDSVSAEQRQRRQGAMGVLIMQPGQQDSSVGQHLNLATCGLKTAFELANHAALLAESEVGRTVCEEACQTKPTALRSADFGGDQHAPLSIQRNTLGHAGDTAGEIHLGNASAGKLFVELPGTVE